MNWGMIHTLRDYIPSPHAFFVVVDTPIGASKQALPRVKNCILLTCSILQQLLLGVLHRKVKVIAPVLPLTK
jgi:hypothetical protein